MRKRIVPFLIVNSAQTMISKSQSRGGSYFSPLSDSDLQNFLNGKEPLSPETRTALMGEKIYFKGEDQYVGTVVGIANCK